MKQQRQNVYTRRLRRSRAASMVALFAMLFQVVFALEHASAMAVAAARGGPDGTPMGIFEICTAQGLAHITLPADNNGDKPQAPRNSNNGEVCALCGTASVSGASSVPLDGPVLIIPHSSQVEMVLPVHEHIAAAGPRRAGTTRGPPV